MNISEMLKKSILLVAHPDDEILWFSSILDKVDEVMFCYLGSDTDPHWTAGRKQSLSEYPMKNISCLGLDESGTFNGADWQNPVITKYGIKISKINISDKKYKENYYEIEKRLIDKLIHYHNVITHNPWGDYGHEEHIQLYRIVKKIQAEMKFNLWFSNYCSNKSYPLMLRHISGFNSEYVTLKTNKVLSSRIENLYKKNGCWSWFDDWVWFNEESFMRDEDLNDNNKVYGHIFPLNMIKKELARKGLSKIFHKFRKT